MCIIYDNKKPIECELFLCALNMNRICEGVLDAVLTDSLLMSYVPVFIAQTTFIMFGFQISLEFHQKKRARWPFPAECIPWEVWTAKIDVLSLANEHG